MLMPWAILALGQGARLLDTITGFARAISLTNTLLRALCRDPRRGA